MQTTNTNNYSTFGKAMYGSGQSTSEYVDMTNTTSNANAMVNVYKIPSQFQSAVNMNMLNPNQNDPTIISRAYYTIDKAYGPPPTATQQKRTCGGRL